MGLIKNHKELDVNKLAFESAMDIFDISKYFPKEETYSLMDQIRRSSRPVVANLAELFRKRRYTKHFVSELSDCEAEPTETQVWLDFAFACGYLSEKKPK